MRSALRALAVVVVLAVVWLALGQLLFRELERRDDAAVERAIAAVRALTDTARRDLAREAGLLAGDPAIVEGARQSDWSALARGTSSRLLALTLERRADLVLIVDALGVPLVQVPAAPRVTAPTLARPTTATTLVAVIDERAWLLALAPLPEGTVVVGRRVESFAPLLAPLAFRPALVVLAGDRALGATTPGVPPSGWSEAVQTGRLTLRGEPWLARPLEGTAGAGLWALLPWGERAEARRQAWVWLAGSYVAALAAIAAAALVDRRRGSRRRRPLPAFPAPAAAARPAADVGALAPAAPARARRALEALHAVTAAMSADEDLPGVAARMLDVVREVTGFECAALYQLDAAEGCLRIVAQVGLGEGAAAAVAVRPLEQSHLGEAARTGRLVLTDLGRSRLLPEELRRQAAARGYRAQVSVPVPGESGTWGVMAFLSTKLRSLDDEEATLLRAVARQVGLVAARQQLVASVREQGRRLEALTRLARTLSETLALDDVLRRVVDAAAELLGASVARLWMVDDDQATLSVRAAGGPGAAAGGWDRLPVAGSLVGDVLNSGATLSLEDVVADPRTRFPERLHAEGIVSAAISPVALGGQCLGALAIGTRARRRYTDDEVRLLEQLASHAAVAINNARLYHEAAGQAERMAALSELGRLVSETLDFELVARRAVDSICVLLGARSACIYLPGEAAGSVELLASSAEAFAWWPRFDEGQGMAGLAVRERRAVATADFLADDRLRYPDELRRQQASEAHRALLAVPLLVRERLCGALVVADRTGRRFGQAEAQLARAFADQAAIALDNARLYRESRDHGARLATLEEVNRLISSSLDSGEVLRNIVGAVARLFDAPYVSVWELDAGAARLTRSLVLGDESLAADLHGALALGEGAVGWVALHRTPIPWVQVDADPRIVDARALAERGLLFITAHPISIGDHVVGALSVHRATPSPVMPETALLMGSLTAQAAVAIENARLYAATKHHLEQTRALLEVAALLNSTLEPVPLLKQASMTVARVCGVDRCSIELWEGDQVTPLMSQFADGRREPRLWAAFQATQARPLREVPANAMAIETRRPVVIEDTSAGNLMPADWVEAFGIGSCIVAPMVRKDQVIGILTLDNVGRPTRFASRQIDLAATVAGQVALALENTRLYTQAQERLRETENLLAVGRIVSEPGPLEEMLRQTAREIARAFGADMVGAYTLDRARNRLVAIAGYHVPPELQDWFRDQPIDVARFAGIDEDWRAGRAIWSSDAAGDPRFDAEWTGALPPHSVLSVPIRVRDEPFGALFLVWWATGREFRAAEIRLVEGMAAQVGLALENAELARQTRDRLRQTETLLAVSRALTTTLNTQALLRQFLRQVRRALDADTAVVWLPSADGAWLEPTAAYRVPPEHRPALRRARISPLGDAFYAEAVQTRRPVVSSDAASDARLPEAVRAVPHRTQVFVPIVAKERVVGGFAALWWQEARPVAERDLGLLETIANQAGVALENARLFAQNRRQVEELSVLYELSRRVTGQLDREALLEAVRTQVARLLDASNMVIILHDEERHDLEVALRIRDGRADRSEPLRYVANDLGLASVVLTTGRPIRTDDYRAECARLGVRPVAASAELGYWLGVPMAAGERVIGALTLRSGVRPFTDADERVLMNLGHLAALALRSARLYEERRRAYGELAAAQDQLVRTEKLRALGEMASGVAHDFNNLLASILGRAQLLLARLQDPKLRPWVEVIERAALDGAQAVRRLQEFTRVRRDQPFTPVDLNQVVRDALEMTQTRWRDERTSRAAAIEVRTVLGEIPWIAGDAAELREALTNLILNAVDAMPEGGALTLTTRGVGPGVELTINDTGTGIPEEIRSKIFDPFFTTKGPQGTGLGLSMTYGIVSRHRGEIAVESEPGTGTVFRLTFPALADLDRAASPPRPEVTAGGPPLRCLVVDDEPTVGAMLGDILEMGGHRAIVLTDGAEAIARFGAEPFDVVFTDLAMPRVSGWQVARRVKEIAPSVAVILVTGFGVELTKEEQRLHAVDHVLVKPLKIQDVLDAVAGTAHRRERQNPTEDDR